MKKAAKIWLVTAAFLVLIGCILFAAVMSMLRWDFTKLSTVQHETVTHEVSEAFHAISMKTDTADIVFEVSNDGTCSVECYEEDSAAHSVTVKDGTLSIELIDERSLSDYIGINFSTPKITVYLPAGEYSALSINEDTGDIQIPKDFYFKNVDITLSTGDVDFYASVLGTIRIKGSTGHIRAENISAGSLDFSVSIGSVIATGVSCEGDFTVGVTTGDVVLTDITCKKLTSRGNTGDISLKNVISAETFSIQRRTGDVTLEACDAAELSIKTDTGDVTGSLRSEKIFLAETSTGDVAVPKSATGGTCKIATNTGDIQITVQ